MCLIVCVRVLRQYITCLGESVLFTTAATTSRWRFWVCWCWFLAPVVKWAVWWFHGFRLVGLCADAMWWQKEARDNAAGGCTCNEVLQRRLSGNSRSWTCYCAVEEFPGFWNWTTLGRELAVLVLELSGEHRHPCISCRSLICTVIVCVFIQNLALILASPAAVINFWVYCDDGFLNQCESIPSCSSRMTRL